MTWAIPDAVELLILGLAGYRIFRLLSIDDFPPMVAVRTWITGWREWRDGEAPERDAVQGHRETEGGYEVKVRRRPAWIDDLWGCPFCLGFWISLALVAAWWAWPAAALAFALPWAVAAILALVTVHLDPS